MGYKQRRGGAVAGGGGGSRCILKVDPTELAYELGVEAERKARIEDDISVSGLSSWGADGDIS